MTSLLKACLFAAACSFVRLGQAAEPSVDEAMGFKTEGLWHTAPVDVLASFKAADLTFSKTFKGDGLLVEGVSLKELDGGLRILPDGGKDGGPCGLWRELPKRPSVVCWTSWPDWSKAAAVELDVYSERPTGDLVSFAVLSQNPKTPWRDWLLCDFKLDWSGWRVVSLPLDAFRPLGDPVGFGKVDGVAFFAKIFGRQPNPYSELRLSGIRLSSSKGFSSAVHPATPSYPCKVESPLPPTPLNHEYPELPAGVEGKAPFSHQPCFQMERSLFKFYPKFHPGFVSFSPSGKAYVNAGEEVEWIGEDGEWRSSDVKAVLVSWAKAKGWPGLLFKWGANSQESMIRFDAAGDAYLLETVSALGPEGRELDAKYRRVLLLHSSDSLKTWSVYELPKGQCAGFEKLDGNNPDCLKRPPAIIIAPGPSYFPWADPNAYLLPPAKKANGKLELAEPVKLFEGALVGSFHSGDANLMATSGDSIYLIAGWMPKHVPPSPEDFAVRPPIPEGHPGLKQSFVRKTHSETLKSSADGVPAYALRYDLSTGKLSEPVYVASGGGDVDGHNWPALALAPDGVLEVLVNGHHNPLNYVRSLKPLDISSWTAPEYVMAGTKLPNVSYATLNCGRNGTLHAAFRSTKDVYNNHIAYCRKLAGKDWEPEKVLVSPFKLMYYVWAQKMSLDVKTGRLFLSYFALGNMMQLTRDQYEFLVFQLPDVEASLCENYGKPKADWNPGPTEPGFKGCSQYRPGPAELVTLVSEDDGSSWRIATSRDFGGK